MEKPRPEENAKFEYMVLDCLAEPGKPYFPYGRRGERQDGIDLFTNEFKVVVQCKAYDQDPKSYPALLNKIQDDYRRACESFPQMERFIVATTLKCRGETQRKLQELAVPGKPISTYFWEDIDRLLATKSTHTANKEYAEQYDKELFLHEDPAVCLRNLFVPQDYAPKRKGGKNLWGRIADFVADEREKLFLIEGDAGCGKTSLVNALAWHALEEDETARRVLGDRPLVIVRLRDLNTKEITRQEGLLPALLAYLKIPNIKTLRARFPKAVLVLDGFDELCLMEGYTEGEDLLYHLCRERLEDYKVIVTSRPNYIRKNLSQRIIPHSGVELLHFKEDKKREWIERFTGDCGQPLKETVQKFILENREEGVSDTPLTLYLFASSDVREEELQNQWALYNRIFFEELTQRQYDNADHPKSFNGWKEAAYQAAGEVAHRMYCTKSEQVRLEGNELDSLKSALALRVKLLEADLQEIIAHSTALCSYWRVTKDRGMVEFYHNNIRDFFLCEWIYTLLNGIYTDREKNEAEKVEALSFFFRDHFRAGGLAERVCTFLYLRACQKKSDDFPAMEREMHLLPRFFERLLTDGKLYDGLHEKHLPTIVSILRCAAQVYRAVLEPFRGEKERIRWWESVDAVNESGMLRYLFSDVFSPHDYFLFDPNRLKCLDPEPAYLSPTDFADFSKLQIAKAYLRGADLRGADLSAADLRGADLRWADLSGAILSSADLIGVILRAANLIGAYLIRADLSGADLCKADLSTAKARWAHLQDAILPDGFKSDDQEKQIAHLRSLNIKGLEL